MSRNSDKRETTRADLTVRSRALTRRFWTTVSMTSSASWCVCSRRPRPRAFSVTGRKEAGRARSRAKMVVSTNLPACWTSAAVVAFIAKRNAVLQKAAEYRGFLGGLYIHIQNIMIQHFDMHRSLKIRRAKEKWWEIIICYTEKNGVLSLLNLILPIKSSRSKYIFKVGFTSN